MRRAKAQGPRGNEAAEEPVHLRKGYHEVNEGGVTVDYACRRKQLQPQMVCDKSENCLRVSRLKQLILYNIL